MFSKPSRKIPKNYRNITGKFSSSKSSSLISYESKLERDFLYLFELKNIVLKIVEQPITIEYEFNGQKRRYTPDFYLQTPPDVNDIIIEVKYYNELKEVLSTSKHKYKALQDQLKHTKTDFYFYTDRCKYIKSEDYKFNTHFLLNYNSLPLNDLHIIKELFVPNITVQDLLNKYSSDKYKQLTLINSLWCMIRRNIIKADLFKKLSFDTQLLKIQDYDDELYRAHFNAQISGGYLL